MLDNQTVMSGSVSQKQNSFSNNNNANSVTYNMTKKPLMTPGQIKRMKKQLEKGKYKLSDLLLENKFLKSDYEKSLYEKSNKKDEAIKIIVEHRKKHHRVHNKKYRH